jgi:uncharacterized protein
LDYQNENKTIMLIVTENCNLRCSYCYEENKTFRMMDFKTAKSVIDKEFADDSTYRNGEIELFGGEAFLNFDLIKEIYDYVDSTYPNITFSTTTNGTLIHSDLQDWLYERRKKFLCTLSLDGPEQVHDKNRVFHDGTGSFNSIDFSFFRETWPGCSVKMTISPDSISNLFESVVFTEELGFDCMATFASGVKWNLSENLDDLVRNLSGLAKRYSDDPSLKICRMLDLDLRYLFYPFDNDFRYCGAGVTKKCYDRNGNAYPCQGLSPLTIGAKASDYLNRDFKDFTLSEKNPCRLCRWVRLCRTCYAANFMETNDLEMNGHEMCLINRLCILASAKIQFARLMKKGAAFSDDEQMVLKAVSIIQDHIMDDALEAAKR